MKHIRPKQSSNCNLISKRSLREKLYLKELEQIDKLKDRAAKVPDYF